MHYYCKRKLDRYDTHRIYNVHDVKMCQLTKYSINKIWAFCRSGDVGRVGFNVPPNTLQVISGTIFMGQMTQPTVSSSEGQ